MELRLGFLASHIGSNLKAILDSIEPGSGGHIDLDLLARNPVL